MDIETLKAEAARRRELAEAQPDNEIGRPIRQLYERQVAELDLYIQRMEELE